MLEPARRLCRPRLGRPAGFCRPRRLCAVRLHGDRRPRCDARDRAVAASLAGLVAVPTALVVFRLRGAYFAIGTWVVAEVCRLVLAQLKQLGGGTGTSLPPDITNSIVGLEWSMRDFFDVRAPAARDIDGLLARARCSRSARSRWSIGCCARVTGLRLSAIRDSETAAESAGVDIFRTKFRIYVLDRRRDRHGRRTDLSCRRRASRRTPPSRCSIGPPTSSSSWSSAASARSKVRSSASSCSICCNTTWPRFGTWYLMLLGALAIVIMLFAPSGIWGVISHSLDLSLFPVRRKLIAITGSVPDKDGKP